MDMKRFRRILLALALCFCFGGLVACQAHAEEDEGPSGQLYEMSRVLSDDYEVKTLSLQDLGLKRASGLEYLNQQIYMADAEAAEIRVFDTNWDELDTIHLETVATPSLLAGANGKLAILDAATSQLVLLDAKTEKEEKLLELPTIDPDSHYLDLEMNEQEAFITMDTPNMKDANILKVDLVSGKTQVIQEKFNGFVNVAGDTITFVNSTTPYKNADEEGFQGGKNSLWSLDDMTLKKTGDLIEKSYPGDFIWDGDQLIEYTSGWSSLDRYDPALHYQDSIAVFEESDLEALLKGNRDRMYLLMPNEQKFYEIIKK